jgi:hypothetical protein
MPAGYAVASTTAVVDARHDEAAGPLVYVARLPSGPLLVLEGTAALIWRAVEADTDVVVSVARETGADPADIRSDVHSFLDELVQLGVVVVAPDC